MIRSLFRMKFFFLYLQHLFCNGKFIDRLIEPENNKAQILYTTQLTDLGVFFFVFFFSCDAGAKIGCCLFFGDPLYQTHYL